MVFFEILLAYATLHCTLKVLVAIALMTADLLSVPPYA